MAAGMVGVQVVIAFLMVGSLEFMSSEDRAKLLSPNLILTLTLLLLGSAILVCASFACYRCQPRHRRRRHPPLYPLEADSVSGDDVSVSSVVTAETSSVTASVL